MPSFRRPTSLTFVSKGGSFADHTDRIPASKNPGVDYPTPTGTPVYMPSDGTIVSGRWSATVGWWLGIDHDNGWGSDLLHNLRLVLTSGWYPEGTLVAYSGATGIVTGPHCHWSLRPRHGAHLLNAGNVDPELFVHGSSGAGGGTNPLPGEPDYALLRRLKEDGMYVSGTSSAVFQTYTDANGNARLRPVPPNEAAFALAGGLVIEGNDETLTGLGVEAGWVGGTPLEQPLPKVEAIVDLGEVPLPEGLATKADVEASQAAVIAAIPTKFGAVS